MKNMMKKLEWYFDYYIAWMLFNGRKRDHYLEYMEKKWGNEKK